MPDPLVFTLPVCLESNLCICYFRQTSECGKSLFECDVLIGSCWSTAPVPILFISSMEVGFKPSEIHFIAQDELISIIPNFRSNSLEFISGSYGPFVPLTPIAVPLWLASALKKNKRCSISPPAWLQLGLINTYSPINSISHSPF